MIFQSARGDGVSINLTRTVPLRALF